MAFVVARLASQKAIYIYIALIWVVVEISAGTCCGRGVDRQMRERIGGFLAGSDGAELHI